jgi:hypothetical protein
MRPEAGLSPDQTSGRFFGIEITRMSGLDRKKEKKKNCLFQDGKVVLWEKHG